MGDGQEHVCTGKHLDILEEVRAAVANRGWQALLGIKQAEEWGAAGTCRRTQLPNLLERNGHLGSRKHQTAHRACLDPL